MPILAFEGLAPTIHPDAWVASGAIIIGDVEIGPQASIWYGSVLRGDLDPIRVGARSNIQDLAVLHTGKGEPCLVEPDVTVGHGAILHGCTIQRGALVGMGACVLNRAVVGPECLVGARALVTEDKVFEPRRLIIGSPARAVRGVTEEELARIRLFTERYVENARRHREGLRDVTPGAESEAT